MKIVSLIVVLTIGICLIGCEDPELVTCQQEKDMLQSQLDQANSALAKKDSKIASLKTENTEMQTQAMESIATMMQKQAENDNKIKQKLVERAAEIKALKEKVASLEKQIAEHQCAVPETAEETVDAVSTE